MTMTITINIKNKKSNYKSPSLRDIKKVATLIKGMTVVDLHILANILIDNENKYGNYNGQGLFQAMKNKHPELWDRYKRV